ncbi:MMPL family transporter [Salinisphaera sp. Q1T1-3]|uniref:MMPL family transporter n=1 Tax=Salinisphaera sp. Q1T1-3 TaxID=2321229 RepID=UPI000E72761A|nr:MMPL family transporter [Salinisphaera sp. Q1T1-3]RJS93968.1 hopanoid biosynthesis-associated RND transporter HpnN [Salinisphaera sp. Q1T1-3]
MSKRISAALAAWIGLMTRHAALVVAAGVLLTLLVGAFAATHLSMDTDDANLISADVGWRQDYINYQHAFPVYTDNLVVVIDGSDADVAGAATDRLADAMRQRNDLFASVYEPGGGDFFARNGFLYLKPDKLDALAARLNRLQPFLGRLTADPTLPTFFDLLDRAMAPDAPVDLDLSPVFSELTGVLSSQRAGQFGNLSWQQLIGGDQPGVSDRRFIIAKPKLDYARLLPAEPAMNAVREMAQRNGLDGAHGVRVRQTGEVALSDEELASVTQGAAWGGIAALIVVAILLYVGLRSWALMGVSLVSLLAGLVGTAAFAALAVGRLNLISIAFAVLYIGLGIDYAIHVCLRYREALAERAAETTDRAASVRQALCVAIGDVGASLGLCAITTAAGFFAFIPTSYSGVAELGLISGAGMFISLLVSLTFLPAAIALVRPWVPAATATRSRAPFIGRKSQRVIWVVAGLATIATAAALPSLRFDPSTLDLKNPNSESVKTYRDLLSHSDHSPLTLVTTRDSLPAAEQLAARISKQPHVSSAITLADYVPKHQDAKLATIGDLALTMAVMAPDMSQTADFSARRDAIASFADKLGAYRARQTRATPAADDLARALDAWRTWLADQPAAKQKQALAGLHDRILGGLPRQVERLSQSLSATRVTLDNLPAALQKRWIGENGGYRVEVTPEGDLSDESVMADFVASVQRVDPHITGAPVMEISAGRTVSHAFVMAFIYAGVFITLFLLVLLRSVVDTLRVLAPLALSGLILSASTVWFGIPFNFANVIALPLLLGVGVDSGIHVVHRLRQGRQTRAFLATSTARAVLLSSMTTMAGFGSLAFSHHAGTASMGQLLTIGMLAILATTLILVPALFPVGRVDNGLKE